MIGDAGLPIPKGVERIDLGWRPGDPAYLDVLEEILKYIVVEKATFADEALRVTDVYKRQIMARDCDGIEQLRIFAEFGGELWLHSRLKIRLNVRLRNTH